MGPRGKGVPGFGYPEAAHRNMLNISPFTYAFPYSRRPHAFCTRREAGKHLLHAALPNNDHLHGRVGFRCFFLPTECGDEAIMTLGIVFFCLRHSPHPFLQFLPLLLLDLLCSVSAHFRSSAYDCLRLLYSRLPVLAVSIVVL